MYPHYGAKNYLDEDFIEMKSTEVYPSNAVYLKKALIKYVCLWLLKLPKGL